MYDLLAAILPGKADPTMCQVFVSPHYRYYIYIFLVGTCGTRAHARAGAGRGACGRASTHHAPQFVVTVSLPNCTLDCFPQGEPNSTGARALPGGGGVRPARVTAMGVRSVDLAGVRGGDRSVLLRHVRTFFQRHQSVRARADVHVMGARAHAPGSPVASDSLCGRV